MNPDFMILIFVAVSILLLAFAKTHIAFVILALCSGYVVSAFAGESVFDFFNNWISPAEFPLFEAVQTVLILLPALLIAYRFRSTQTGLGRFMQQFVPALALTLLAVVFMIDIVALEPSSSIREESYLVGSFEDFAPLFVIFAIATALFDVLVKHANEPIRKKRGRGRPPKH